MRFSVVREMLRLNPMDYHASRGHYFCALILRPGALLQLPRDGPPRSRTTVILCDSMPDAAGGSLKDDRTQSFQPEAWDASTATDRILTVIGAHFRTETGTGTTDFELRECLTEVRFGSVGSGRYRSPKGRS